MFMLYQYFEITEPIGLTVGRRTVPSGMIFDMIIWFPVGTVPDIYTLFNCFFP